MRLLFLSTGIGYRGAYKIFVWLMNQLVNAGHEVTLLTYRSDKTIDYQSIDDRIRLFHMSLESRSGSIMGCIKTVIALRHHIKEENYDMGMAFLPPSQIRLVLACKGTRTKSVISQRGDPLNSVETRNPFIPKAIVRKILYCADAFVFQTSYAQSYYPAIVKRKSTIIPNPVIQPLFTLNRKPENRIVSVARLDIRHKRQDVLIKAFNQLANSYPNYSLELYGDGNDEEVLRNMAKNNRRIKFMGISDKVVEEIRNAAMFVLTSDFEGIPNALLEAMSLGIPCIATDYSPGGIGLLIKSGINGLVVRRDDENALAKAMERFITDRVFAESCGTAGQKSMYAFSEDKIAGMWIDFIAQVCKKEKS